MHPLLHDGILRNVLGCAEAGQFLFIVTVCKQWREQYNAMITARRQHLRSLLRASRCANITTWNAAFASPERLQVALASGLVLAPLAARLKQRRMRPLSSHFFRMYRCLGQSGSIAVLEQALELGVRLGAELCAGAAATGDLAKLKWLHCDKRCPWTAGKSSETHHIGMCAESSGSIEMLRWIWSVDQSALQDCDIAAAAASKGRTETLQLLHELNCAPLDTPEVYCTAALNGHLSTVKWLLEHCAGSGWGPADVCEEAAESGSVVLLIWLCEQLHYSWSQQQLDTMLQAAGGASQLAACEWLRQHGAQWPAQLIDDRWDDYKLWPREMRQWAVGQGCAAYISDSEDGY
jgi:hypothetical protein